MITKDGPACLSSMTRGRVGYAGGPGTGWSWEAGPLGAGRVCGMEGLGGMSARYDCTDAAQRAAGITEATAALRKGELAVMPTDTVYGIAADAFSPEAVTALLAAKGRVDLQRFG